MAIMSENQIEDQDPRVAQIVAEENQLLNETIQQAVQQVQFQHLNQRLIEARLRIADLEDELESLRREVVADPAKGGETENSEE